ncbi:MULTISPECIES: hypothetical protein [unclassified Chelatococcus]|jgi:hypothetical protein|uniref:hypothetical protein n=1 Tax=unclassified Chelatococcus TaxID=2638111 RepID=UPI001BCE1DED|nr:MULTISPECIES: hypothetical protein [unclassified Chelatococcus]CAH1651252.1 conserved hypothetical protein [Hyphomicrobiales bacterium]MBS7739834.1 hypothetical protein [Chelatococcus sp. HY11]MBX3545478.1 hypothetical protein [Chelatococcus sp.]MCO5078867.1 hypothetical protein [Chelatococcus sp.]CAH1686328.1 conserved hypothetical protein [Hyphomicrobiales bacterium]
MSHDALFQLGMGAVLLNASQTEESFRLIAAETRAPVNGAMYFHRKAMVEAAMRPNRRKRLSMIAYAGAGTADRRLGAMPPPSHRCASNRYAA